MADDSWSYLEAASDLKDFRIDYLHIRTPGYPLLLLITASSEVPNRALFFLSLLLHFTSIWILASILYSNGLTEMILILFGLLLLLPPYVEPAAYVLSENLTAFMLVVGLGSFVLWSRRGKTIWLFISALAIGYAGFTRPPYAVLACAMAGSLFVIAVLFGWSPAIRRNTIKASLTLIGVSIILVGGYALLNHIKFGYFGLSPMLPISMTSKTSEIIERLPDEYAPVREFLIRTRDAALVVRGSPHTGTGYLQPLNVRQELADLTGLQEPQLANYVLRLNLLLIRKAPLQYLYNVSSAFSHIWFPSSTMLANMDSRFLQLLWVVIHFCLLGIFAITLVVFVGGLPYMLTYKRFLVRSDRALLKELTSSQLQGCVYILAGTIVIYGALIASFFEAGDPRYRVPTDGLIVLMTFLGTASCCRSVRLAEMVLGKRQNDCEID